MNMDISSDTIASILGLLLGGGSIGTLLTWRYQRNKAKAEAKQAEAEAEKARVDTAQATAEMMKTIQDGYQQMIADMKANLDEQKQYSEEQKQYIAELKEDRQHLRSDNAELRNRQDKSEEDIRTLKRDVARNGRMVECMRPFLCGREKCAIRVPVTITPTGEIEKTVRPETKDIEPLDMREL
jgi:chromosome segregation ATPase